MNEAIGINLPNIEYKITDNDDFKAFRETKSELVYKLVKDYNFWLCTAPIQISGSIQENIFKNHIKKRNKNNHKIILYKNEDNTELYLVIYAKNKITVEIMKSRFCTWNTSAYVMRALAKAAERAKNEKIINELPN